MEFDLILVVMLLFCQNLEERTVFKSQKMTPLNTSKGEINELKPSKSYYQIQKAFVNNHIFSPVELKITNL